MPKIDRKTAAIAISHLMPNIIQGAHLGVLSSRMMTQSQFLLMLSIHARGQCPMGSLAAHMKVQLPTMTGMVNRLVTAGYLKRIVNNDDRRQVVIELTPKGSVFLKDFQSIITRRWEDVLKSLDDKEVESFHHIIVKLNKSLKVRQ